MVYENPGLTLSNGSCPMISQGFVDFLDGSNGFSHENHHVHRTLRQILLRFSFAPRAVTPVTDITERAMAVTRPIFPTHGRSPRRNQVVYGG